MVHEGQSATGNNQRQLANTTLPRLSRFTTERQILTCAYRDASHDGAPIQSAETEEPRILDSKPRLTYIRLD